MAENKVNLDEANEQPKEEKAERRSSNVFNIFRNDDQHIEFRTVNLLIKIVGVLAGLAILIFVIQSIGESIFQPLFNFLSILSPFLVGLVFAWLLTPVVSALVKRNWRPTTASLVVTLVGVTMLLILFGGFGYVVASSIVRFFTGGYNIGALFGEADIISLINNHINESYAHDGLLKMVVQAGVIFGFIEQTTYVDSEGFVLSVQYALDASPGTSISELIGNFLSYFWKFVISAMVVGFMLPNFSNFGNSVKSAIPKTVKEEWSDWIDIVSESFSDYMRGALTIASIIGITYAIGLGVISLASSTFMYVPGQTSILTFQNTSIVLVALTIITFGILGTLTNLIPYAGPFIGGIPIIIIIALNDTTPSYWVTWAAAMLIILIQSLESMFLQPYIMGKQTRLHPVAILLGLTLFGSLFGIVGMLISTPIISVGRSVIRTLNERYDIY